MINIGRRSISRSREGGSNDLSAEMASSGVKGDGTTLEIGLLSSNGRASGTSVSASMPEMSCCCGPCKLSAPNNDLPSSSVVADTGNSGPFKLRELSDAERTHLEKAGRDPCLQKMRFSTLFRSPHDRLKKWPRYFAKTKESGEELRDGYVTLWTTLIVADTLLASVAIQPFITNGGNLSGWRFEVYGLVWMLALIIDFMGLSVTIIFLGFLFGNPGRLTDMWVCNIGVWIGVPVLLLLVGTFASLIAIAYSTWVIYGQRLGIVCIIIEVLVVAFACLASDSLGKAGVAVEALE